MKNSIVVEPDAYVFLVPKDYLDTYYRILVAISTTSNTIVTKFDCKTDKTNIVICYNMMVSAIAARHLGKTKLADTIIKYVEAVLDKQYPTVTVDVAYNEDALVAYKVIPKAYIFTYAHILTSLADYGERLLYDCKLACSENNRKAIQLLSLFYTVLAAEDSNDTDTKTAVLNYITNEQKASDLHADSTDPFVLYLGTENELPILIYENNGDVIAEIDSNNTIIYREIFDNNYGVIHYENVEYYDTINDFPGIGTEGIFYYDMSTNSIYLWDDTRNQYNLVGMDPDNINLIDANFN